MDRTQPIFAARGRSPRLGPNGFPTATFRRHERSAQLARQRTGYVKEPIWTIVLAAGQGNRYGRTKQYERIGQRSLVDIVVDTAAAVSDGVVVVLPKGAPWQRRAVATPIAGGEARAQSVRAGLAEVPPDAGIVVIHDAAHPLATPALFLAVIDAVRAGSDAAVPVLPLVEPLKRVNDGIVVETVPRESVYVAQTPHAFRASVLREAHASEPDAVEDSELVETRGGRVTVVAGEVRNLHVVTPDDLDLVRSFV
jgi:2-C-methyl-D-erythritol 4-phosphate cytidylyltransferase